MRVALYTWGSEGDIRPFLALARGLVHAGHDVTLSYVAIDGRDYTPLAESLGVQARSVAMDAVAHARATTGESDEALAGKGHPLSQIRSVFEHFLDPAVEAMWDDAAATLLSCDVAIIHLLHHPATSIAFARRVPFVVLQPVPMWPTREFPPMGAPDLGRLNRVAWWSAGQVGRSWFLPRVNASRARAGAPRATHMFPQPNPAALTLTCVSPTLVPRPADWEPSQRVPGFLEIPADAQSWAMPTDLASYLAAGPPPLLMGFGSMLTNPSEGTRHCVRMLIEAAQHSGHRALVQAPWALLADMPASPQVFRLGRAPHALVLPHCSAFVHHGGAGTTHTACLAGKPSVVVPFLGDQFFWAQRLHTLGVAPAAVPRRSLDARRLAHAIHELFADPRAQERAHAIARAMTSEDGVAEAVRLVEACVSRPR